MRSTVACGHLLVGGFHGAHLPTSYERALRRGERAGAILFRRNLVADLGDVLALTRSIAAAPAEPPVVAVDQEGGRVARLGAPLLRVPPMRTLAALGGAELARRVARAQGAELAALGFTTGLAPVLDVDTCATNPIIGDRSFGGDPRLVSRYAAAYAEGLQESSVFACGKHYPGHGDTTVDSHLDLPVVDQPRERIDAVELAPFRAAAERGIAALMTAHVVYPGLDPSTPATLSRAICTDLLRGAIGFRGALISDDLEMKAVADRYPIEEAACAAIRAGCDVLLVCSDEERQARAYDALVREADADPAFLARCREAATRSLDLRRRFPPRGARDAADLAARLAAAGADAVRRELAGAPSDIVREPAGADEAPAGRDATRARTSETSGKPSEPGAPGGAGEEAPA